jgi:hypothetical protein
MTSLNTCLKSKPQAQAGGANGAVTFETGAVRINPEFDHTARREDAAGNGEVSLTFPYVANINLHHSLVANQCDEVPGFNFFDLCPRGGHQVGQGNCKLFYPLPLPLPLFWKPVCK